MIVGTYFSNVATKFQYLPKVSEGIHCHDDKWSVATILFSPQFVSRPTLEMSQQCPTDSLQLSRDNFLMSRYNFHALHFLSLGDLSCHKVKLS